MSYCADKLVIDGQTHAHTHTQAATIPEGQNWPRVKSKAFYNIMFDEIKVSQRQNKSKEHDILGELS